MMAKFIDNYSLLEEERKSIMKDPSCNAIQDHLKAKGRDRIAGVHLPTLLSSGNLSQEDCPRTGNAHTCSSSVAPPALVPLAAGESGGTFSSSSSSPTLLDLFN